MNLTYGAYQHAGKTVTPRIESEVLETPRGQTYAIRQTVTVEGTLVGDDAEDVAEQVEELIAAYATPGQDLLWTFPDDSGVPELTLRNSACVGGVRVIQPPSFVAGEGPEYSNYRKYVLTVQGDVRLTGASFPTIWEYSQTLSRVGTTGPVVVFQPTKYTRPLPVRTRAFSLQTVTQTGTIAGTLGYLLPATPIWPAALKHESATVSEDAAPRQWINGVGVGWARSWTYTFESATPLPGAP